MDKPTKRSVSKLLSVNDTGENGSHQAGILVPRDPEILSFFPPLDQDVKNPRCTLAVEDECGIEWHFNFIYYNNKFFDERGTRNEYRLTGMTKYLKDSCAKAGDTIVFVNLGDRYSIRIERAATPAVVTEDGGLVKVKITASNSWKVISY